MQPGGLGLATGPARLRHARGALPAAPAALQARRHARQPRTAARSARCASASSSRRRTSSPTPRPKAWPRSSTASRCARSTISRSTATCSASTPRASSISPAGCARDRRADAAHGPTGFPRRPIAVPRPPQDRPDPHRLRAALRALRASIRLRCPLRARRSRPWSQRSPPTARGARRTTTGSSTRARVEHHDRGAATAVEPRFRKRVVEPEGRPASLRRVEPALAAVLLRQRRSLAPYELAPPAPEVAPLLVAIERGPHRHLLGLSTPGWLSSHLKLL